MCQEKNEVHFKFEITSVSRKLVSCALLMMRCGHSFWRNRACDNIVVDSSSDVSSDEEESDRFCFIMLVSGN